MAFGVTVDFNANIARFSSQLDRATQDMNRFARTTESAAGIANTALSALGVGLGVGAFTSWIKSSIDLADSLKDLSKSTGLSVENLSGLKLAATQSGTDLEGVAQAINKLSVNMGKDGEKFKQLGIDAKDPLEAFAQLSDLFVAIDDPQKRAALGAAALGKSWATTAPLLAEGGNAIRQMVKDGQEASGMTAEFAANADKFNDELELMKTRLGGVAAMIASNVLEGFNQLIGKIIEANAGAASFNRTLTGIGNFAFDKEGIRGLSVGIDEINDKIVAQKDKIQSIAKAGPIGGLVNDLMGYDVTHEKRTLDNLLKDREKLVGDFHSQAKPLAAPTKINTGGVDQFIRGSGSGSAAPRHSGGGGGSGSNTEENRLKGINDIIAALKQDIDLSKLSEAQRRRELELSRDLKTAKGAEVGNITNLVKTKYDDIAATDRQEKQWKALIEDANAYYDLKKANSEFTAAGDNAGFNERLAATQDAYKAGTINEKQMKAEFDKLGKGFNDNYINPAKTGQDDLNQFMIQGARNMQTAMADFIFDPFTQGTQGMLTGFLAVIRKMASEIAAAQLMKGLLGDFGTSGNLGGIIGSLVGSLAGGATGGGGGGSILGKYAAWAHGGVLSGPGISAYSGTIVNRPTVFPFAAGMGLMGEAGAEAILPLKRTAGGKLGVEYSATGQAGRAMTVVNNFTLNQPTDRRTQDQISLHVGNAIDRAHRRNA